MYFFAILPSSHCVSGHFAQVYTVFEMTPCHAPQMLVCRARVELPTLRSRPWCARMPRRGTEPSQRTKIMCWHVVGVGGCRAWAFFCESKLHQRSGHPRPIPQISPCHRVWRTLVTDHSGLMSFWTHVWMPGPGLSL